MRLCVCVCARARHRGVRVDLGGPDAKLPVSVGVSGVLRVVRSLTAEDSGAFFDFRGERVQW